MAYRTHYAPSSLAAAQQTFLFPPKKPKLLLNDNYAGKPEGIHLMIGRRPNAAFGNSIGDREMQEYTKAGSGARLAMLVLIVKYCLKIREAVELVTVALTV
jgi:hypothetical protein